MKEARMVVGAEIEDKGINTISRLMWIPGVRPVSVPERIPRDIEIKNNNIFIYSISAEGIYK